MPDAVRCGVVLPKGLFCLLSLIGVLLSSNQSVKVKGCACLCSGYTDCVASKRDCWESLESLNWQVAVVIGMYNIFALVL